VNTEESAPSLKKKKKKRKSLLLGNIKLQAYRLEFSADTGRISWVQGGGVPYCPQAFTPVSVHLCTAKSSLKSSKSQ